MTTGTYVYCLVRSKRAPSVPRSVRGLPGARPVRALAVDESLWLLVSDVPLARYGAPAIEAGLRDLDWVSSCAVGHESVVERFTTAAALAPMKLFTIFENDERAQAAIRRDRRRLERTLDRVAGRQEWGVRVLLDERRAMTRAREHATRTVRGARGAGATFLVRKKAERDAARRLVIEGRRAMEPVFAELAGQADDARQRGPTAAEAATRLLLDAAFLVPAGAATRFKRAAGRIGARLARDGHDLAVTGPWPPYSFVAEQT
ncbi:MAG: GvpL/GvpF family gas vesicle protein [Candidatus Rokubacteria bacterium]|nr:GvpL/GvpF family gas vesicle protein [Candidatus Rokubacteria bacterium]